jgi:hypothetical protein
MAVLTSKDRIRLSPVHPIRQTPIFGCMTSQDSGDFWTGRDAHQRAKPLVGVATQCAAQQRERQEQERQQK